MTRPPTHPMSEPERGRRPPTLDDERRSQARLMAEDRMVAIGSLAQGIAHEINTPVQYIGDSAHFIHDASRDILRVLETYRGALSAIGPAADSVREQVREVEDSVDIAYLEANLLAAVERVREGARRVAHIVRAMKDFGVHSGGRRTLVDLNACLDTTLAVTQNAVGHVADVERDLAELPPIEADLAALHQVFLNLVLNSVHALEDLHRPRRTRGHLLLRSRPCPGGVEVIVADTGCGIPEAIRHRIFDPFFTTKEVGRGTGQGLTIARDVIHRGHGGRLELVALAGWTTAMRVFLPGLGA
ncbi:MAG TPA: ATP-binding protein [Myxococcota bacterium]|nr:ATP-binding protein [Myxococcota bacterium]